MKDSIVENNRNGIVTNIEMITDQGDSLLYKFTLDNNLEEELTVCVPYGNADETPNLNQSVLVFLHPADSSWPKHTKSMIRDVPAHVISTFVKNN